MRSDSNHHHELFDEDLLIKDLEEQVKAAELQYSQMQQKFTRKLSDLAHKNHQEQQRKFRLTEQFQSLTKEAEVQKLILDGLIKQLTLLESPLETQPKKNVQPHLDFNSAKSKQSLAIRLSKSFKTKKNMRHSTSSSKNEFHLKEKGLEKIRKSRSPMIEYFSIAEPCRRSQRNSYKVLIEAKKSCKV